MSGRCRESVVSAASPHGDHGRRSPRASTMSPAMLTVRGATIAALSYLFASQLAMALAIHVWLRGVTVVEPEQVRALAEASRGLLLWQAALGGGLCVFGGAVACHFGGPADLKAPLAFGLLLIGYGIPGWLLHPTYPVAYKIAGFLTPVPLALLGGLIRLRFQHRSGAGPGQGRGA